MGDVVLEIFDPYARPGHPEWIPIQPRHDAGGLCSFSTEDDHGTRQVYIFGQYGDEIGVWRSRGGIDIEDDIMRAIAHTEGLDKLSDLSEPWETTFRRPAGDARVRVRIA